MIFVLVYFGIATIMACHAAEYSSKRRQMSETGYEKVKCQVNLPGCKKTHAGYQRRKQYAQVGPWLDACEACARIPYDQPVQFQDVADSK